jgi:DNA gyrase/topoisomerase IV subunit B
MRILRSSQPTRQHKVTVPVDWVVPFRSGRDVDGQHLRTHLPTLVFRFMKPLIEAGHLFLAHSPLSKSRWPRGVAEFACRHPRP